MVISLLVNRRREIISPCQLMYHSSEKTNPDDVVQQQNDSAEERPSVLPDSAKGMKNFAVHQDKM